ncbi:MAG: hypothetical protein FRX49_10145 [Trebouxia sp. A1-2]|nr:MAG: hypothetical protein FRX49_10145 [Trebouxia sp. A1-2]
MAEFRKWTLHFEDGNNSVDGKRVQDPPGFTGAGGKELVIAGSSKSLNMDVALLKQRRQEAMLSKALGSFKQVGFLCFMMWMSGSQIHLFSIMMLVTGIYQPLSTLFSVNQAIPQDQTGQLELLKPRLVFCAIQIAGLIFALNKLQGMGLLPTNPSDYVSFLKAPVASEFAGGGVRLGR